MRPHFTWSIVRYRAPATAVDSVLRRNSREYRLVFGDRVICLGSKIEFSRGCAIAFVLALTSPAFGQDAIPISRTNRSILQPEEEAQITQPSGFTAGDHMTGDWGGWRERLFTAGVEVVAFDNSFYYRHVSGGNDHGTRPTEQK